MGDAAGTLPAPLRDLHTVLDERRWEGRATVTRGRHLLARLVCRAVGFPPAGEMPVAVTFRREGEAEVWTRDFGGHRVRSVLTPAGPPGLGRVHERFGPVRVELALAPVPGGLALPVRRGAVLGLPLPCLLLPRSDAREAADGVRATFDVALSLPLLGLLIRYRGWLLPR